MSKNQIAEKKHYFQDYTVEVTNRFKGLDLTECLKTYGWRLVILYRTSLVTQMVKHLPTMWETQVQSLGPEDLLEKEMATPCSTLAWKTPWREEPGTPQSMGVAISFSRRSSGPRD